MLGRGRNTVVQDGWGQPSWIHAAHAGQPPHTTGALSLGWAGREALPAARYSQGLHCVAAAVGSRWLPGPTRGGPAASRESGGGHDGPSRVGARVSWARSGHST